MVARFANLIFVIRNAILILLLTSITSPLLAAPVHVEIIVFKYHRDVVKDSEWFLESFEKIEVDKLEFEDEPVEEIPDDLKPQPTPPTQLLDIASKIAQNPDLDILTHISWVQEPNPRPISYPVYLDVEFEETSIFPELTLSGTAFLYEIQLLMQLELDAVYKPVRDEIIDTVQLPEQVFRKKSGPEYRIFERRSCSYR